MRRRLVGCVDGCGIVRTPSLHDTLTLRKQTRPPQQTHRLSPATRPAQTSTLSSIRRSIANPKATTRATTPKAAIASPIYQSAAWRSLTRQSASDAGESSRPSQIQNVWNFEANLAELVEQAADIALEKKDPRQRFERRRKRRAKQETNSARANDVDAAESVPNVSDGSDRYVPAGLRDEVLHRAQYRPEFVSHRGTRCSQPKGHGQASDIENCARARAAVVRAIGSG